MRFFLKQIGLAAIFLFVAQVSAAQTTQEVITTKHAITIPLANKDREDNLLVPQRGDSKQSVEAIFGQPNTKQPAKGTPPISRWNYPEFTVFFESNHVIHSTAKH